MRKRNFHGSLYFLNKHIAAFYCMRICQMLCSESFRWSFGRTFTNTADTVWKLFVIAQSYKACSAVTRFMQQWLRLRVNCDIISVVLKPDKFQWHVILLPNYQEFQVMFEGVCNELQFHIGMLFNFNIKIYHGAIVIVWRVRGKIIMSVLCNIVCNNCTQWNAHCHTHMNRPNISLDWVLFHWAHFTVLRFIFMVALWNRTDHYIFARWFLLSFFPCLISAIADWMSAILPHMVWP